MAKLLSPSKLDRADLSDFDLQSEITTPTPTTTSPDYHYVQGILSNQTDRITTKMSLQQTLKPLKSNQSTLPERTFIAHRSTKQLPLQSIFTPPPQTIFTPSQSQLNFTPPLPHTTSPDTKSNICCVTRNLFMTVTTDVSRPEEPQNTSVPTSRPRISAVQDFSSNNSNWRKKGAGFNSISRNSTTANRRTVDSCN